MVTALKPQMEGVLANLRDAERTGEPPLRSEYRRKKEFNGRIRNGFRLPRFWNILNQLNGAALKGFNEKY